MNITQWMDLRIDYAFKAFFTSDNGIRLISLLNAIFANKAIPRRIISLTITNPNLEKLSPEDKYSILDIRANLDDNTFVLIEMHLYGLTIFKHKTVRSWARVYGESLTQGDTYTQQRPGICISFTDGPIADAQGNPIEKTHALFHIMERDSHQVLLPDLEMHYIDMKSFVQDFQKATKDNTAITDNMFTNWLTLITHATNPNKEAVTQICNETEELKMAATALANLSADKNARFEYEQRLDNIRAHKWLEQEYEHTVRENAFLTNQVTTKDQQIATMAKAMHSKGTPPQEIAQLLNKTEQEVVILIST